MNLGCTASKSYDTSKHVLCRLGQHVKTRLCADWGNTSKHVRMRIRVNTGLGVTSHFWHPVFKPIQILFIDRKTETKKDLGSRTVPEFVTRMRIIFYLRLFEIKCAGSRHKKTAKWLCAAIQYEFMLCLIIFIEPL